MKCTANSIQANTAIYSVSLYLTPNCLGWQQKRWGLEIGWKSDQALLHGKAGGRQGVIFFLHIISAWRRFVSGLEIPRARHY